MARPSSYTVAVGDLICERLAQGESLRAICASDDMPDRKTVLRWKKDNEAFRLQYAHAREDGMDAWADLILEIADEEIDPERVAQAKLRVDTRKWLMSKLKPGTYGEKVQHGGDPGNPIVQRIERTIVRSSDPDSGGVRAAPAPQPL